MTDFGDHSYLLIFIFMTTEQNPFKSESLYTSALFSLSCYACSSYLSWTETKKIIDEVHKYVYGHSSYNYIKLLLDRNEIGDRQC